MVDREAPEGLCPPSPLGFAALEPSPSGSGKEYGDGGTAPDSDPAAATALGSRPRVALSSARLPRRIAR